MEWLSGIGVLAKTQGGWLALVLYATSSAGLVVKWFADGRVLTKASHEREIAQYQKQLEATEDRCKASDQRADKYLDALLASTKLNVLAAETVRGDG